MAGTALSRTGGTAAWRAPAAVAAAGLCACAAAVVAEPDSGPVVCPLRAVTGWWCPLCGSTRAIHVLARGDVVAGLRLNALIPLYLAALVVAWVTWTATRLDAAAVGTASRALRPALVTLGTVMVAFAVVRNLPWEPFGSLRG